MLAEEGVTIDVEQMIIAAITDIEGPQLALLDLPVRWTPRLSPAGTITGPLDIPADSVDYSSSWRAGERERNSEQIAAARPGLVVQNDNAKDAIEQYTRKLEEKIARYEREAGSSAYHASGPRHVATAGSLVPALTSGSSPSGPLTAAATGRRRGVPAAAAAPGSGHQRSALMLDTN